MRNKSHGHDSEPWLTVRRLRETDKRTPVVMATTAAEKSRVLEAIQAGVNNYVVKPFTAGTLLDKIKRTLDRLQSPAAAK